MASSPAHYIIIGGGTSGLVVANRLSEDLSVKVLVIEAGNNMTADPRVNIPAFWTSLLGSEADWQYQTANQLGLNGRTIKEVQGKALGGSSAINGMAFIAPSQADIDAWGRLGNIGWDWAHMAPFYQKFYTLQPPEDRETLDHLGINWISEEHRGTAGPLKVSFPGTIQNPLCKAWIDAFKSMEKLTTGDPMSGKSIGGYSNAAAVDPATKTRSYAASAYGDELLHRSNVQVLTGTAVQRILFEVSGDSVTATGVCAIVDGESKCFTASTEIILAAGVFSTPKLLELSGVGQKMLLERHGIPVVIDSPGVGEHLQDHLMTGVSYEVADNVTTADPLLRQEPEALAQAQDLYLKHQAGPFTIGGVQSSAFMRVESDLTELLKNTASTPENQNYIDAVSSIIANEDEPSANWFMFQAQANLHESAKSFVGSQLLPENFISLGLSQSHPLSRGTTHIASADFNVPPLIDPGYFSHPVDLDIMTRHVQALEAFRHNKEISIFLKPDGKRNHPDAFKVHTYEGAKKYVLDTATTTYHNCGSAAMLPREKGGVVATDLKVYGTTNLRIVDASVFPVIPRGNIMTSVYAVAERAADIIKRASKRA